MAQLPMTAAGERQRFFSAQGVDELVSMVLELSTELWVVRQRQFALERVLDGRLPDLVAEVESYKPSPQDQAVLEAMRAKMVGDIFRALESQGAASPVQAADPA
jgi:hypothetical protein